VFGREKSLGARTNSIVVAVTGLSCACLLQNARGAETGACPFSSTGAGFGITDDGCGGADKEPPQYPGMLERYGKKRPPFNVAGVDYHAGIPSNVALHDPESETLPDGCSYREAEVTCSKDNTVISGYDFSLRGVKLHIPANVSGTIITSNKFGIGPACRDPLIDIRDAGSITIAHNTFDGGGPLCPNLVFGTFIFAMHSAGAESKVEYNVFSNIPIDVLQYGGPTSGKASIIVRYNLFYIQGFTGHPDGFQAGGGNLDPIDISFNTYYNVSPPSKQGAQPFHVEAQLNGALNRSTVSYNTIVTPGYCDGGRGRCAANFDIACKKDADGNSNTNFSAYGNYIDSSGALAPLLDDGACSGALWGVPAPNLDLRTGSAIPKPKR
jgi:hypothetical protein